MLARACGSADFYMQRVRDVEGLEKSQTASGTALDRTARDTTFGPAPVSTRLT